ncbi:hypothetical protein [Bradyrhizobium cosmicum]|uniref:hypothetical protein n=1 Tax=Bradyrhizobium cosmicum TaxID=1404864 RepID=UPI0028E9C85F|nr:hypothetical protein [Bradyrhizobium cosmicum]
MIFLGFCLGPLMLFVVSGESPGKLYARATSGATLSSQNAAALLIDLGTVDIRCVGTKRGEYSQGVFRVKTIGRLCARRAWMSHAQV